MQQSIHIRSIQLSDIESIFTIRDSVTENYLSRAEVARLGFTPTTLREMLQQDCIGYLAVINDAEAGFVIANTTSAEVLGLFVRPEYEGKGIGKRLLKQVEAYFVRRGYREIWLTTNDDRTLRACQFYEHLGWVLTEKLADTKVKYVKTLH